MKNKKNRKTGKTGKTRKTGKTGKTGIPGKQVRLLSLGRSEPWRGSSGKSTSYIVQDHLLRKTTCKSFCDQGEELRHALRICGSNPHRRVLLRKVSCRDGL